VSSDAKQRNWLIRFLAAPLLSPLGLLSRSAIVVALFAVCHLAGLREYASILSGTPPTGGPGDKLALVFAGLYILLYFVTVIVIPVIIIAAGVMAGLQALLRRKQAPSER
jgi:hypothetical protein